MLACLRGSRLEPSSSTALPFGAPALNLSLNTAFKFKFGGRGSRGLEPSTDSELNLTQAVAFDVAYRYWQTRCGQ